MMLAPKKAKTRTKQQESPKIEVARKTAPRAASYDFVIPAQKYAIFYYKTDGGSKLNVVMMFYKSTALVAWSTINPGAPFMYEVWNTDSTPTSYTLRAGILDGLIVTRWIDVKAQGIGGGVQLSFFTGETDTSGNPISKVVFMQIQDHP